MKKIFAIVLAMIMMLSMAAMAVGTITVPTDAVTDTNTENAEKETYVAYKIFDVTKAADVSDTSGYAYTMLAGSEWVSAFVGNSANVWFDTVLSADGTVYNVTLKDGVANNDTTAKAVAAYLNGLTSGKTETPLTEGANSVADGYYLVVSSLGANLGLCTTDVALEFVEKNTVPTSTKTFADGTTEEKNFSVNDTVDYKIVVKDGEGTNDKIVLHDVMDAGLTLNVDSIKINGAAADATQAIVKTSDCADGCTFEIEFTKAYVTSLAKDAEIVVTYSATVNAGAIDADNVNKSWINYSNYQSVKTQVEVETYKFNVEKIDAVTKAQLTGAEFKLYNAATEGTEIPVVLKSTDEETGAKVYRLAVAGETGVAIEAGFATIEGLAAGTYYLEETVAPTGYNKLPVRKDVGVVEATVTVQVENSSGSALPSTGGIGTTIFYVVGGLLMAAAVVLLVTNKKMSVSK